MTEAGLRWCVIATSADAAEEEGEEAMMTLVTYGPVIVFIVIGIMLYGWLKARQEAEGKKR